MVPFSDFRTNHCLTIGAHIVVQRLLKMRSVWSIGGTGLACLLWIVGGTLVAPNSAHAVTCGTYAKGVCGGEANQYAGGFNPGTGFGCFGGGKCKATKTPVIFIHGNGDNATSWDAPPGDVAGFETPPRSAYAEMKVRGYNDCELFGVTYLSDDERKLLNVGKNYHQPSKYR